MNTEGGQQEKAVSIEVRLVTCDRTIVAGVQRKNQVRKADIRSERKFNMDVVELQKKFQEEIAVNNRGVQLAYNNTYSVVPI